MRYIIYLRVSTELQEVETQKRMAYDRMNQLHPDGDYDHEFFIEEDCSTRLRMSKRPQLQEMLAAVRKGDTVIIYQLDRLSRDIIEMVTIYRMIIRKIKANLISLNEPALDDFSVSILGAMAQKERDMISMRTKHNLETKRVKGERRSGQLPYGCTLHPTKKVPIRVGRDIVMKPGVLIPSSHEQKGLALMQKLFAAGKSYQEIATALSNQGYMNREGQPFHKMSVYRILARTAKATSTDRLPAAIGYR